MQLSQFETGIFRLGRSFAGEVEGVGAERDGAVERAHQRRRHLFHFRIVAVREAVRHQLRGRQHAAQIVVDLADRGAERGQALALLQRLADLLLQLQELALRHADLVAPARRRIVARHVLRIGAEIHHALGQVAHRTDQQPLQRQEDQRRRHQRDDDAQAQDAPGIGDHRLAQRRVVQHHVDPGIARLRGLAAHAQQPVAAGPQGLERILDQSRRHLVAEIDLLVDDDVAGRRAAHDQVLAVGRLQRDDARAGILQQPQLQLRVDHEIRRRFERQDREIGARQLLAQPVVVEARDRRRIDQDLAHHHEADGERQQPGRQASAEIGKRGLLFRHPRDPAV